MERDKIYLRILSIRSVFIVLNWMNFKREEILTSSLMKFWKKSIGMIKQNNFYYYIYVYTRDFVSRFK